MPVAIEFTEKGQPKNSIANFLNIMQNDGHYSGIKYNILTANAEIHTMDFDTGTMSMRKWNNNDISASRNYIEETYGLYNKDKHRDALNIFFQQNAYNPILDLVSSIKWDGIERCESFLIEWAKAEDSEYTREVSRLIFAGGIWRLVSPGCKVDDVPVLVGKQGNGKSSLVRFLAINDDYFGEVKTTDGDAKSVEQINGKWICEIPELSAFTKAKEVESVKAFITRQRDMYRTPYAELVEDRPRRCSFIGTTNNPNFLVDLSGNRRFYPVLTHCVGYDLYDREDECRDYILQCWAEAKSKYDTGQMPNFAKRELTKVYEEMQDAAMQDDWRVGAIQSYLDGQPIGSKVCVKEIMNEVISPNPDNPINPTKADSKEIGIIMSRIEGWERISSPYHSRWGTQRGWEKVDGDVIAPSIDVPSGGGLPF